LAGVVRTLVCFATMAICTLTADSIAFAQEGATSEVSEATADEPASGVPRRRPPQGFFEIVFSGGPVGVGIMLCLIGCSLSAVYLMIEQAMTLRRKEIVPETLTDNVREMLLRGQVAEAAELCRNQPSPLAFVLLHGINEAEEGWPAIEKSMEDALAEQTARLYRRVEYLSVLGNISPMLGLLGTVVGMILCFAEVANTQGQAGAPELAEGIYQALVTTVAGLMIAIPALGAFAIFRNRVDELSSEAAYIAQHALAPLKRTSKPPPPPPQSLSV